MPGLLASKKRSASVAGVALALLLAGCAKSTPTSGGGPSSSGAATVDSKNISGVGTVLVNAQGFTLYHLKPETSSNIQCTGSCTRTWPPLLIPSGASAPPGGSGGARDLGAAS